MMHMDMNPFYLYKKYRVVMIVIFVFFLFLYVHLLANRSGLCCVSVSCFGLASLAMKNTAQDEKQ